MGREPGDFLSAGSPKVINQSTGGTLKPGINSSLIWASMTPQIAPKPANKGTSGSHPTLSLISFARVCKILGKTLMSMLGGAGRRPAMMSLGAMGAVSTDANNDVASGMGRVQPDLRAMWKSVPNLTALTLSVLNDNHWCAISRSPGYLPSLCTLHSCHKWYA